MTLTLSYTPPANILVFDSGAGGLSIAQEILALTPGCHLIYAPDTAFFPYGTKDDAELTTRIVTQVGILHQQFQPDLVVIACNTASTLALDMLRTQFDCPFVGVVPAIKPAAAHTQTGVIGVLATPATISRRYTKQLISDFAGDKHVILAACEQLVAIAEDKLRNAVVDTASISRSLEALFSQERGEDIDTVVLACTHFPLLKHEFAQWAEKQQRSITWIDSGKAIAQRVKAILGGQLDKTNGYTTTLSFATADQDTATCYEKYLKTSSAK